MVYGNYDPAYIQPVCDLCGRTLKKRYEYLPFEIETARPERGIRTSEHEGHLCNDCNELEDEYPISAAQKVKFHFMGDDPSRLVMIDVFGTHRTGGDLKCIHKFGPEDVPNFLRCLRAGIVSGSVRSVEFEDERIQAIEEKYANASKCTREDREASELAEDNTAVFDGNRNLPVNESIAGVRSK